MKYYGAVEAGGTKCVCAVLDEAGEVCDEVRFETHSPQPTLERMVEYFRSRSETISAFGVGSFGPISVLPSREDYGEILATPKAGWQGANIRRFLLESFPQTSVVVDTDVNAAALAEWHAAGADPEQSFVYVTVGTGIGGGVVVGGATLRGEQHPEIGHLCVPQLDDFGGSCEFHRNCIEGFASGTAMKERWGKPAQELGSDHPAWKLEADYLAALVQSLTATIAPHQIVLGGGVMEQPDLLNHVRSSFDQLIGGYWDLRDDYLILPRLGNRSGVMGCWLLARKT